MMELIVGQFDFTVQARFNEQLESLVVIVEREEGSSGIAEVQASAAETRSRKGGG